MAAPTCLLYTGNNTSSIDINDGTIHTILSANMGADVKTWDTYRSYSGSVAQYNVSDANEIPVTIVLRVKRSSVADLRTTLAALNTSIDGITAGTTHLVYAGTTYHLLTSPLIEWEEDPAFLAGFYTVVTLELLRNNVVA